MNEFMKIAIEEARVGIEQGHGGPHLEQSL